MLRFIVPAYNEEKNIGLFIQRTREFAESRNYDYQIIVINDGSTDRTPKIIENLKKNTPIIMLDQVVNKGVGEAFRRGFSYSAGMVKNEDVIVSIEADNTSDLSILDKMLKKIDEGYDLVLASCYMPGGGISNTTVYRKVLSLGANLLLKTVTPLKNIYTFSSFYRVYRAGLIKKAYEIFGDNLIEEKGFSCMVELLLKLSKLNIKIAEVPMMLCGNLRRGKSKMKIFNTIVEYIRLIWRGGWTCLT